MSFSKQDIIDLENIIKNTGIQEVTITDDIIFSCLGIIAILLLSLIAYNLLILVMQYDFTTWDRLRKEKKKIIYELNNCTSEKDLYIYRLRKKRVEQILNFPLYAVVQTVDKIIAPLAMYIMLISFIVMMFSGIFFFLYSSLSIEKNTEAQIIEVTKYLNKNNYYLETELPLTGLKKSIKSENSYLAERINEGKRDDQTSYDVWYERIDNIIPSENHTEMVLVLKSYYVPTEILNIINSNIPTETNLYVPKSFFNNKGELNEKELNHLMLK